MRKRAVTLAVLAAVLGGVVIAQATNPLVGTWKLNVEKSKSSFKSGTTIVQAAGDGIKFIVDLTAADGTTSHWEFTAQYDGKDYPVTGGASIYGDAAAITRVDARTTQITNKYRGKVMSMQTISVSADGKTRTTTTKGTDVKGQPINTVAFYEKQ